MTGETFRIGELAGATGTKVETIRWYERIGLLTPPARTGGNYRAYGSAHLARLSFIRRARDLSAFRWTRCASCCAYPISEAGRARRST
jgi:hypothetical protein